MDETNGMGSSGKVEMDETNGMGSSGTGEMDETNGMGSSGTGEMDETNGMGSSGKVEMDETNGMGSSGKGEMDETNGMGSSGTGEMDETNGMGSSGTGEMDETNGMGSSGTGEMDETNGMGSSGKVEMDETNGMGSSGKGEMDETNGMGSSGKVEMDETNGMGSSGTGEMDETNGMGSSGKVEMDETNGMGSSGKGEMDETNGMDSSDEIDILMEESPLGIEDSILKDKNSSLHHSMDNEEREKRYKNLLALLENSTKISNAFETRLKNCKLQIIKNELEKANKVDENVASNVEVDPNTVSNNQRIANEEYEDYYLKLFQQPKLFNGTLKNYQKEGLLWIRTLFENGLNGILADDMGLGKTIQTIAFYCFLLEMGIRGPLLIIAPLSTIPNWLSEFFKFAPQLKTLLYHGSEIERYFIRQKINTNHKVGNLNFNAIVITTYEILRMDTKFLKSYDWKFITIDEGHKLKNSLTITNKCLREFACANKLILTGTPIQNNMNELWTLLNLLMPKLFNDVEDFSSWFVLDDFCGTNDRIVNIATKDEILDIIVKILKPFILRRQKSETDLNLPPKKEIVIYAPVTDVQHKLYVATLSKEMDTLLNKEPVTQSELGIRSKRKCVQSILRYTDYSAAIRKKEPEPKVEPKDKAVTLVLLNPFIQLKKICNHPYLVHMPLIPGKNEILVDENIVRASGKFLILDAMLSKLKLLGHKVLLFSTMTQLLDLIEEFLIFRSFEYTRLDGSMKIVNRVESINTFTNDPDCFLMLISTRAGGLGLNLTAADTVIIFDSDWNPQCDLQAQDRCHRIGQVKPVVVYRLCTKSTVDEKILAHAAAKRKLEKIVIGNGTFNRSTKINLSNIKDLMNLLESSDYDKQIQSNGFILSDEELDSLLDRSDMVNKSTPRTNPSQSAKHFEVLA